MTYFTTNKRRGAVALLGLALAASLFAEEPARGADGGPTPTPVKGLTLVPASAGSGGMPAILAGDPAAATPDLLEPNDTFEQAHPIDFGVVYENLNFVPAAGQGSDPDFMAIRTKPGMCLTAQTGDLGPALDTTLLLWRPGPLHQDRKLLAQNDDAVAHSPTLGSVIHWCQPLTAPDAQWLVLEVRNYGGGPATSPLGNTYSLVVSIDPPPTATPTRTPRPTPPPAPAPSGGIGGAAASGYSNADSLAGATGPAASAPPVPPTPRPVPPTATWTATPVAPTATVQAVPPTAPVVPAATARATASSTPAPVPVSVDVIVYTGESTAQVPPPGAVVAGYPVSLVDLRTNAILPGSTVQTDANGHVHLTWTWTAPVVITVPEGRWTSSPLMTLDDVRRLTGPLYARLPAYILPSRWP